MECINIGDKAKGEQKVMGNKILSNCFGNKRNSGYKPIRIASCFQEEGKLTLNEKFYNLVSEKTHGFNRWDDNEQSLFDSEF